MTWSSNASIAQAVWGQVAPQSSASDDGVDFEYQFRETYPMIFSEDRPIQFVSSLSEGNP